MNLLKNHWDTFLTEDDVAKLSQAGITHVRIPIGYWTVTPQQELDQRGENYLTGQWTYLTRSIGWFKTWGIKAIIDLHGAPGSQNGFDNR